MGLTGAEGVASRFRADLRLGGPGMARAALAPYETW